MSSKRSDRRRFLKEGTVLAGLAVGAIRSASGQEITFQESGELPSQRSPLDVTAYGVRSRFDHSVRKAGGVGVLTPHQDLDGIITPPALHYVVNHLHGMPDIDPRLHRLLIHGLVDRPLVFTMDELKRLPSVTRVHFLACAGNSYLSQYTRLHAETVQDTHGGTSCSEWTGVLLSTLLKEVGVQKGARWLLSEGAEAQKGTSSIPLEKAMDDCLVAYSQNGAPLRPEQGYPLRLLAPGFEGVRNIKWLRRIKVVDQPYMTRYDTTLYVSLKPDGKARWFQLELEPNSVITRPSGGQRLLSHGFHEITGIAWSGGGSVRRVEVSTNGGQTWKDAEIQGPVHRMAHARFRLPWNWNGEEAVLQARCTDERGETQPSLTELSQIWGVKKDFWQSTTLWLEHFNAIQPWKVTTDGSVHNAIWES